jgi:hypothetical protein
MTKTISKNKDAQISREKFADVVTVCVNLGSDDMTVVAYEHARTPAILVTRDAFDKDLSSNQKIDFRTVSLNGFEGYRIWCCEIIEGTELRVCLVR